MPLHFFSIISITLPLSFLLSYKGTALSILLSVNKNARYNFYPYHCYCLNGCSLNYGRLGQR